MINDKSADNGVTSAIHRVVYHPQFQTSVQLMLYYFNGTII